METILARRDGSDTWRRAEARFSPLRVMSRVLAHLLLPTCLLEFVAVWLLVPSWGVLALLPFLVLPVVNLVLLRLTGGASMRWSNCEACVHAGRLVVRLPGKDMFVMEPSTVRVLADGRLEARNRDVAVFMEPGTLAPFA